MYTKIIQYIFTRIKDSNSIKNVISVNFSLYLKLVFQSIYFIILTRVFGPSNYGSYVGVIAIISFFMPFASWGGSKILIQKVSRSKILYKEYCGAAILKTLFFGSTFIIIILLFLHNFPIPKVELKAVFLLALSNLVFLKISDIYRDAFLSVGLIKYTTLLLVLVSANRCFASVVFLLLIQTQTLFVWSMLYCVSTLITTIFSTVLAYKLIGLPGINLRKSMNDLRLGFSFSVGVSAESIYNDLDKSMLAQLSTVEAAGIYGAAYHVFNVSLVPVQSVLLASWREFFRQGACGIKGSLKLCRKLLPLTLVYSVIAAVGIAIIAPFLPIFIGEEYSDSAVALIWLAPLIIVKTFHAFAADVLTGADHQKTRSSIQILIAALNGTLNFFLIPLYSWHGAIWATMASELALMILLWSFIYFHIKRQEKLLD